MLASYPACQKRIIDSEGTKYTDGVHPYDPGGPTRYGITLKDARLHWKPNATANDVRLMPITVALAIYKSKYWDASNCDALPAGLDYTVMDYGVNSGIGRSGKVLRRLCGLSDHTSKINAEVLAAVAKRDAEALIHAMNKERLAFLKTLAIWPTYKGGWTTRVYGVDSFSTQLAHNPALAAAAPKLEIAAPTLPGAIEGPLPNIETNSAGMAKGQHAPPTAAKNAIKLGTPTIATGSGFAAWDWVVGHPGATAVIATCVVVLVMVAVKAINDHFEAKQTAPLKDWEVVPELAAAQGSPS